MVLSEGWVEVSAEGEGKGREGRGWHTGAGVGRHREEPASAMQRFVKPRRARRHLNQAATREFLALASKQACSLTADVIHPLGYECGCHIRCNRVLDGQHVRASWDNLLDALDDDLLSRVVELLRQEGEGEEWVGEGECRGDEDGVTGEDGGPAAGGGAP